MKSYVLVLFTILAFGGFVSAQSKQISIRTGETKSVNGSKLNVKFLGVVEDSRCPKGTTCIWAGNAKVSIRVWKKNQKPVELELNSTLDPRSVEVLGYKVTLAGLSPKTGKGTIDANEPQKEEPRATAVLEFTKVKS
jgi:predicted SPOUT superfamily RNA methylase MTH1